MKKFLVILAAVIIVLIGLSALRGDRERTAMPPDGRDNGVVGTTPSPTNGSVDGGDDQGGGPQDVPTAWPYPNRPYTLYLPAGRDVSRPTPLVLALHGGGANSEHMRKLTCPGGDLNSPQCLDRLADREGFAVVYPNGTAAGAGVVAKNVRTWNAGGGAQGYVCVSEYACEHKVDDLAYFRALLADVAKKMNIDRNRVYATGISNGAAMSHRLACELADWIVGIAPVGGGNQFSALVPCNPSRPVSVLEIHGEADGSWPIAGGQGRAARGMDNFYSVIKTVSEWVSRNGCVLSPRTDKLPDRANDATTVTQETYTGCRGGAEVVFLKIAGGGHTWPQGNQYMSVSLVGRTSQDFNANDVIWQFFKNHPRR